MFYANISIRFKSIQCQLRLLNIRHASTFDCKLILFENQLKACVVNVCELTGSGWRAASWTCPWPALGFCCHIKKAERDSADPERCWREDSGSCLRSKGWKHTRKRDQLLWPTHVKYFPALMKEQSWIETLGYLQWRANGSIWAVPSMLILLLYTLAMSALSNAIWLWKRLSHSQQLEGVESVKHSFGQIGDLVSVQNPEHRRDSQQKTKHTHPYW